MQRRLRATTGAIRPVAQSGGLRRLLPQLATIGDCNINANPSRVGQINGAGDPTALFLKQFGGKVLATFLRTAAFRQRHLTQTIAGAKSAQFPATGILTAYNHVPGDELVSQNLLSNEKVVFIEGKKVAPIFVADIDELMAQYDQQSIRSEQVGQALSKQYDQDVSRTMILAARQTTPNVLGVFPNDTLTSTELNSLFATDGPTLVNGMLDGVVLFDQRDIPMEDRTIFVRPVQHALVIKDGRVVDTRFNERRDDLGGLAMREVKMVGGAEIVKTNNYANTNDVGNALQPTQRQHDYSTSQFILSHKSSAGTVNLAGIQTQTWTDYLRQGNWLLGKYICGHDWLRPEASFEGQSAAPAG